MVPKSCLDCGITITSGYRCVKHNRIRERTRNALPRRKAYQDPVYKSYVKDSKCAECGVTQDLTKDHIISLIRGGNNAYLNLQTLCKSCNSAKK